MSVRRVCEYAVVCGVPAREVRHHRTPTRPSESTARATHQQAPITDIAVIFPSEGETPPQDYICVTNTPAGHVADLNYGSIRCPTAHICYRRGRDKPPLVDIGVLYEGKERVMSGCELVHATPCGRIANVNNSTSQKIFLTYRRASPTASANELSVAEICVVIASKGERSPHAFNQINKNLNKGLMGSDVFVCYRKSMTKSHCLTYDAEVISRYPLEDRADLPFPDKVGLFSLPMGASVEQWDGQVTQPQPVYSTFVLTTQYCDRTEKIYCAGLTFYEPHPYAALNRDERRELGLLPPDADSSSEESGEEVESPCSTPNLHTTKSICLLSRWPFFEAFNKFLVHIYRLAMQGEHQIPIERYLSHFLHEIPFPSPHRPTVQVQLSGDVDTEFTLTQPEHTQLPMSGASYCKLLRNLTPDHTITLFLLALMEQKILVHSLRPAVLTQIAEALSTIIFPFVWQCPY